jgi:hypothetical protein
MSNYIHQPVGSLHPKRATKNPLPDTKKHGKQVWRECCAKHPDKRDALVAFGDYYGKRPKGAAQALHALTGRRVCGWCGRYYKKDAVGMEVRCKSCAKEYKSITRIEREKLQAMQRKFPSKFMSPKQLWNYARSLGYSRKEFDDARECRIVNPRGSKLR